MRDRTKKYLEDCKTTVLEAIGSQNLKDLVVGEIAYRLEGRIFCLRFKTSNFGKIMIYFDPKTDVFTVHILEKEPIELISGQILRFFKELLSV